MRPRSLAPRILAVVLSACLILPPHAYALRPQQREDKPQRVGLEEALRSGDPDALIRVASSLVQPFIAASPGPVTIQVGLEEGTADSVREMLQELKDHQPGAQEKVAEWFETLLYQPIQKGTSSLLALDIQAEDPAAVLQRLLQWFNQLEADRRFQQVYNTAVLARALAEQMRQVQLDPKDEIWLREALRRSVELRGRYWQGLNEERKKALHAFKNLQTFKDLQAIPLGQDLDLWKQELKAQIQKIGDEVSFLLFALLWLDIEDQPLLVSPLSPSEQAQVKEWRRSMLELASGTYRSDQVSIVYRTSREQVDELIVREIFPDRVRLLRLFSSLFDSHGHPRPSEEVSRPLEVPYDSLQFIGPERIADRLQRVFTTSFGRQIELSEELRAKADVLFPDWKNPPLAWARRSGQPPLPGEQVKDAVLLRQMLEAAEQEIPQNDSADTFNRGWEWVRIAVQYLMKLQDVGHATRALGKARSNAEESDTDKYMPFRLYIEMAKAYALLGDAGGAQRAMQDAVEAIRLGTERFTGFGPFIYSFDVGQGREYSVDELDKSIGLLEGVGVPLGEVRQLRDQRLLKDFSPGALLVALERGDPYLQYAALSELPIDPQYLPVFMDALRTDREWYVRAAAVMQVAITAVRHRAHMPASLPVLYGAMEDRSLGVREEAATYLKWLLDRLPLDDPHVAEIAKRLERSAGLEEDLLEKYLGFKQDQVPPGTATGAVRLMVDSDPRQVKVNLSVQPGHPYGEEGVVRVSAVAGAVAVREKAWTLDEHLRDWEKGHPKWKVLAMTGNGNVKANDHFVTWANKKLHFLKGEPFERRKYPSVVIWENGRVTIETLEYKVTLDNQGKENVRILVEEEDKTVEGKDKTTEIDQATFGPPLILKGKVVPAEEWVDYIYDIRSLFTFPYAGKADPAKTGKGKGFFTGVYLVDKQIKEDTTLQLAKQAAKGEMLTINLDPNLKGRDVALSIGEQQILLRNAGGYTEVKSTPLRMGEFRFPDPANNPGQLEIVLRVGNPYPHHVIGTTKEGKVIDRVVGGSSGQQGVTLMELVGDLQKLGAHDAVLIDSGGDVMLYDVTGKEPAYRSESRRAAEKEAGVAQTLTSVFIYSVHKSVLSEEAQQRFAAGSGKIRQILDQLGAQRWLQPAWSAAFQRFAEMAPAQPGLFDPLTIFFDQTSEGLGSKRLEVTVPRADLLDEVQKERVRRYLLVTFNNAAWAFLRQPQNTFRSETRITLAGPWAQALKKEIDKTIRIEQNVPGLIGALSPAMLYGPISLGVADPLPAVTETSATQPVTYVRVDNPEFDPRAADPVLGVDVGATNIKFVILRSGRVVYEGLVPDWTQRETEVAREGFAAFLAEQILEQLGKAKLAETPKVIGIAWFGPVRSPRILGATSIQNYLKDKELLSGYGKLIGKIHQGQLQGDVGRLEEEYLALGQGRFMDLLEQAMKRRLQGEWVVRPYRDSMAEAFGVAVATRHPAFTKGVQATRAGGTVVFTLGTGAASYVVEADGSVAADTRLYELGRVAVDMEPDPTKFHRATGVTGTPRDLYGKDALIPGPRYDPKAVGEALAATALVIRDLLGVDQISISGGNANPEFVDTTRTALQRLDPKGAVEMEVLFSPTQGVTGATQPIYTPAIGAAWAALADTAGLREGTAITKEMAAGIVRGWNTLSEPQRDQVVADLAAHGYTWEKYQQHRDLIHPSDLIIPNEEQDQATAFADFPVVKDGKSGSERDRLLELGSRPEVLGKEGVIIAAGGEGTRLLENSITDGLLPPDALKRYTKPTAPVMPVTGKSTLVYQLETLSDEAATREVPLPVRVVLHEEVGTKVAEMIEQNGGFGLPHLELVYAGMNAALDSKGLIVLRDDGTVSMNPDGTGGVVRAVLQNGGDQWFESILGSDAHVVLLNGDMLLEPELIHLVAGAGRETPVVGVGYAYPPERGLKEDGTPGDHKAKLGTFAVLEQGDRRLVKIVEYRERGSVAGFNAAVQQAEAVDGTVVQANSGLYGFPLEGLLAKTQNLPPHHQKDKDALGVTDKVQKVEEFATDIPAEYDASQVGVLSVDPAILTPIKDPAGLRKVREMAIVRERQRAEALGVTLSPEARVEFHPAMNRSGRVQMIGQNVRADGAVGLYIHPEGVRLYTRFQAAKPWEPFDPAVFIDLFPTVPGQPVVIPDGTVFSAGLEETQVKTGDLMPLRGADYFAALGGTSAPVLQLAGEAFLKQEGVLEMIQAGGGVLSLGAEAATRLYGAPATAAILVRSDASPARVGPSAALGLGRVILADKDIPVRANWPWVKVGDWPELRQAMPSAGPRDFIFVEKEPGVTRERVASVLSAAFPQGGSAHALLGTVEEYNALPDNALDLLGRAGQPPVVVLRVEMELKSRSGETFHLIIMA